MNFFSRKTDALWICFLASYLLVMCSTLLMLHGLLADQTQAMLEQQLPASVETGLQSRINRPGEIEHLLAKVNADLHDLPLQQSVTLVDKLWVVVDAMDSEPMDDEAHLLSWKAGDQQRHVWYYWGYDMDWPALHLVSVLGALILTGFYYLFPRPLSELHRRWFSWLLSQGESRSQAKLLTADLAQPLSPLAGPWLEQLVLLLPFADALVLARSAADENLELKALPWLLASWRQQPYQVAIAINVAKANVCLEFDLYRQQLWVHGICINVAQTPLFYYLWYALQREAGEGWLLNPSSQQADIVTAKSLVALMRKYGGHPKAIAELEEHGLRAKTLDQNRSKIKDAFCAVLGEELAVQLLFESEKDRRTGRSRYRLARAVPVSILNRAMDPSDCLSLSAISI